MMLKAFDADGFGTEEGGHWFMNGGAETADSYAGGPGRADRNWRDAIPKEHIAFLRRLPTIWRAEDYVFVHAGIDPMTFPEDNEDVHMWTRSLHFTDAGRWPEREELKDITVVHGHTPQDKPEIEPQRINVDTGACYGGPLTAVMLQSGKEPSFLIAG
jgi:serine/threonine protein phosphatase 1